MEDVCPCSLVNDTSQDCYADDRDSMNDYAKYFNNTHLSDLTLCVGLERFAAHKIVMCKSSDVFDRMLSQRWDRAGTAEIELAEAEECAGEFSSFLRFLYCNHVQLNGQNVLPILMLADKYAVVGLQAVCVDYAISRVLPALPLRQLMHVWFRYSTTAYHQRLTMTCVRVIAQSLGEIVSGSEEWEADWLSLDRDQLVELLKSNDLCIDNEFQLWEAVQRWFNSAQNPERRQEVKTLVGQVVPLVRFPYMSAEELDEVENSCLFQEHEGQLRPLIHLAYKFISMNLTSREFNGIQFLLRDYKDDRWEKRIVIDGKQLRQAIATKGSYHANVRTILNLKSFQLTTKASTYPRTQWEWELVIQSGSAPVGYLVTRPTEDLSVELHAVEMDQQRSVEFMLTITDDTQVLRTFTGKKTFTKSRPHCAIDLDNRMHMSELVGSDPILLHNDNLLVQMVFRPIV